MVAGLANGVNILQWEISNGTCEPSKNQVTITVEEPITIANAGSDQTICEKSTTLEANQVAMGETGKWSLISGSASFSSMNNPNAMVAGLANGVNILQWEISNGTCEPSKSQVTITYNQIETANYSQTGNKPTESRGGFNYEFLLNKCLNCLNLWNVNGASGYDFHVNEQEEAIAIEMDGSGALAAEVRFSEGECDTTSIINDPIDLTGKTNVKLRLRSDVPVDSFLVMLSYLDDNGIVQQADLNGASIALSGDGEWITFTVDLAGFFGQSQRVASFTDRVVGFSFRAVNNDGSQPQGTIEIDYMKFGADEKVTSVVEAKTYAVNVYPNPSSGTLNIIIEVGLSISLMDAMGVEIAKGSEKLFVEGLQAGIYITAIYNKNGSVVETRKVIVK